MTESQMRHGATGKLEVFIDRPEHTRAIALVLHPHSLLGGTAHHKVPVTIMRAQVNAGISVYRPNFRGVNNSEGAFDGGELETQSTLCLIKHIRETEGTMPLTLIGFSFGAYVATKSALELSATNESCDDLVVMRAALWHRK
ncbi:MULTISPECIES: alpha/beta hydrolase [Pseudomonas]